MGVDVAGRWDGERPAKSGVQRARRLRVEMTVAERWLWEALRGRNLNIRRQAPMGRYIVDFVCHAAKLVIEVDGYYHRNDLARQRDAERDAWLKARGYTVLRLDERDVRAHLPEIVEQIVALTTTPNPNPSPLKGEGSA